MEEALVISTAISVALALIPPPPKKDPQDPHPDRESVGNGSKDVMPDYVPPPPKKDPQDPHPDAG